jgi:hypothetical protein
VSSAGFSRLGRIGERLGAAWPARLSAEQNEGGYEAAAREHDAGQERGLEAFGERQQPVPPPCSAMKSPVRETAIEQVTKVSPTPTPQITSPAKMSPM